MDTDPPQDSYTIGRTIPIRRRTDAERIDYFMMEVAALSARVQRLERANDALRKRIKRLEDG